MNIKEITLLSKEECVKYKPIIPLVEDWWWLRSPGFTQNYVDCVYAGTLTRCGGSIVYYKNAVRPALRLTLDVSDSLFWYKPEKLVGTNIKYGKYTWTVLNAEFGKLYVLCDEFIAKRRFDFSSNNWDKSELKHWLETEGIKFITPQGDDIDDITNNNPSDG